MDMREGEVVVGTAGRRWVVGKKRGQGTCCTVHETTLHGEHRTKAALKVYKEGENFAGAHDREALILELIHKKDRGKHIVFLLDDVDHQNVPCLVQQLLECDIRQTMAKLPQPGLSLHLIQKLAWQILVGVEGLHSLDFIHGDLKPTNLMWDPEGGVLKVIDLSLSFHVQDQNVGLLQSQGYRAPETEAWNLRVQSCGGDTPSSSTPPPSSASASAVGGLGEDHHSHVAPSRPSKPSDLWSVGCILVEMFTGEKMFTRNKLQELLSIQAKQTPGGNGGDDTMALWLTQLLRARPQDQQQPNHHLLLAKFKHLVSSLLQLSQEERMTAEDSLLHSFFTIQTAASVTDLAILPTRVLRFLNMIDEDEDLSNNMADIEEDVREECEKFGPINKISIPTSGRGKGKIYVEFGDSFSSVSAFTKLCRKTFNRRTVIVSFYPLEYMQAERLE